jgi:hypothetical protein
LTAVLRNNFKAIGSGAAKIENGEFAIQDSATKKDIDLETAWEACFSPGQRVAMSMVFTSIKKTDMNCPKCQEENGEGLGDDEDVEW